MKRFLFIGLTLAAVLSNAAPASAQQAGQPYQRPAVNSAARTPPVSPYLNLNRGGSAAINYYGIVRPQQETAQSIQQLQTQIGQIPQQAEVQPGVSGPSVTGLQPQFSNFSHYFPQSPKAGGGGGSFGAPRR